LTIKSISNTKCSMLFLRSLPSGLLQRAEAHCRNPSGSCITCSK